MGAVVTCRLQDIDNLPASEARRRLEAFRKKQQAAAAAAAASAAAAAQQQADAGSSSAAAGGSAEAAAAAARVAFEGAISEAFEDSLKYYVAEEQKEVLLCYKLCVALCAYCWYVVEGCSANMKYSSATTACQLMA